MACSRPGLTRPLPLGDSVTVQVYELQLRVHSCQSDLAVPIRISRSALVTELRDRACRSHKLDRTQCSVYNYMGLEKGRALEPTSTLHDAGILDDQDLLLDKRQYVACGWCLRAKTSSGPVTSSGLLGAPWGSLGRSLVRSRCGVGVGQRNVLGGPGRALADG